MKIIDKLDEGIVHTNRKIGLICLYQAGAPTIMEQVLKEAKDRGISISFTLEDAQEAIDAYFKRFPTLKKWIDKQKEFITRHGFIYSYFGRKRRLPNVLSTDRAIKSHAIRSGVNFLVQSPASDVNLLAAIEMNELIKKNKLKSKIFALVHDSILAEVPDEEIELYKELLRGCVQKNRGLNIPGYPIGCDFEIADDYSMLSKDEEDKGKNITKFEKLYGNL